MPRPRPDSLIQMRTLISEMLEEPARRCFAVQRLADEAVVGRRDVAHGYVMPEAA